MSESEQLEFKFGQLYDEEGNQLSADEVDEIFKDFTPVESAAPTGFISWGQIKDEYGLEVEDFNLGDEAILQMSRPIDE